MKPDFFIQLLRILRASVYYPSQDTRSCPDPKIIAIDIVGNFIALYYISLKLRNWPNAFNRRCLSDLIIRPDRKKLLIL